MGGIERVLVVDDHQVFADLVSVALESDPTMRCVGSAATVEDARRLAAELRPDLALVDVRLPDGDGLDLAAELLAARPELRVVVLTAYPRADLVERARAVGVAALLAKELSLTELLAALRDARPDAPVLVELQEPQHGLTRRELEVLELLGEGSDVRAIARTLGISPHTTRDHVKNVLAKLGARTQLDAVVMAARSGILRIGAP
ncbi:response regulator transcription factor [Aeromicrobium sp. 50.2.37]|uniref:response regulator transcription factor n=1 Tax=Aeromicrobium sp. 50.2.37 TaxID=2969305 RepID=UPI00215000F7|nr:response regulator transcription factor [Aeromicrobium sp. 50.2.37]MCR4512400.1 response regulator transcription factor [Aeromicrobium sp. 50.2.37]